MDLTSSYRTVFDKDIVDRFQWSETRNAAAVIYAAAPERFTEIEMVLHTITLGPDDVLGAGGSKSDMAARIDLAFREFGWREGHHDVHVASTLKLMPWKPAGETKVFEKTTEVRSLGYKTDNLNDRIAVDTEWNAKDGNLDRDLAAYRALYDVGIIDAAVIITRTQDDMRVLATSLDPNTTKFNTTTTTNLEKLSPRLTRGDGGGCPVLAVAINARMYDPKA